MADTHALTRRTAPDMNWKQRYIPHLGRQTRLQRKLHLAFGFFFLCPVAGFIFFGVRYNLLSDEYVPYFFLGLLVFAWLGFSILKGLFERITAISARMTVASPAEHAARDRIPEAVPDELRAIVDSFESIRDRFGQTARRLEKKSADISVLKDLSELCYVTSDPEEILYIALERALLLTASDIGSVLSLERRSDPKAFTVKATIGLGSRIKPGDRIDFDSSIAKYAVLNKSPLLVENIEQDKRFGRANLDHYGTTSFVCMPIKTHKEIIGVLTVSSRDPRRVYTQEEVEALTPLLGNAAFTFENLRLLRENDRHGRSARSLDRISKVLNSSFHDGELLSAVLHELQSALEIGAGAVLIRDDLQPGSIQVRASFGLRGAAARRMSSFPVKGSLVEKALQEEASVTVEPPAGDAQPLDAALFEEAAGNACCLTPLRTGGNVFGVLLLVGRSRDRLQESQPMVGWVAGGIALSVERNRLLAALAKREQEMATIRQVGGALASSTFDLEKVLTYTMDMIHEVMNAEAGSLLFLENGELEVAVAFNGSLPSLRKFKLKLGQGIAGCVAARGEAIIVNDMERSLQFFPVIDEESGFRTRSALCVPMISQGRVIGVIEVLNKVNGPFDGNDRDLLQALAASVCIALENARLYKETVAAAAHERDVRRVFQKFVPKEVVDKIVHGADIGDRPVIEEVKRVTLLNIDIRGFSRISRRMGPQRTVALLNRFFAAMGEVVFRHHGVVDKYLGDGFLAVFGVPVSGPDDADNAVRAALEMQRILTEENAGLLSREEAAIHMGISIHTGEVVVGNIGFEKKMDYTVIGEAVNTVFRMQGLLKSLPDGILISDTTLQAVQSKLSVTPLETPAEFRSEFGHLALYELAGSDDPGRRVRTGRTPDPGEVPAATRLPAGNA